MTLDELNRLPEAESRAAFERCCGASAWARAMCAARPFPRPEAVHAEAERIWRDLAPADWREAFEHHPRIGDVEALRARFAATAAWAAEEQRGAAGATGGTLARLADGNHAYQERFGYIFIVCATGQSADQMLALLEARLRNTPEAELPIAAGEQMKITRLRLEKLLGSGS